MSKEKLNPVLRGIIDTFLGVKLLRQSIIPHKNRLAVILLDSAFETACRGYLQYETNVKLSENHKHRDNLVKTVKSKLNHIDEDVWKNIEYYYNDIRCDFYHQSAGKTITDVTLLDYQDTIEFVINEAFQIKINQLVEAELTILNKEAEKVDIEPDIINVPLHKVKDKVFKVLIVVEKIKPKNVDELNEFLRKQGDDLRLSRDEFIGILGQNRGSKKFFYYDKSLKIWNVSSLGKFKLNQLKEDLKNG